MPNDTRTTFARRITAFERELQSALDRNIDPRLAAQDRADIAKLLRMAQEGLERPMMRSSDPEERRLARKLKALTTGPKRKAAATVLPPGTCPDQARRWTG